MSIIIRLQNLPWSANSADIRHFFGGLVIPEGGVHIIGGVEGDAFIAFDSDEDARIAMQKNGLWLKDNRVKLFLSSRAELQQLIEQVRKGYVEEPSSDRSKSGEQMSRRRRSSERLRRRSIERRGRSSPRRAVRSRSSSRRRDGNESDKHRRSRRRSRSKVDHRSSPPRYKDSLSERLSNDKYKEKSSEQLSESRHMNQASPDRIHEPEVRFVNSAQLYDRRSPTEQCSVPYAPHQPSVSHDNLDIFAKYIASKMIRRQPLNDLSSAAEGFKDNYPMENFEQQPNKFSECVQDFKSPGYRADALFPSDPKNMPPESMWHEDSLGRQKFPENVSRDSRFLEHREQLPERQFSDFNRLPPQFDSTVDRALFNDRLRYDQRQPMFQNEGEYDEMQPNYCIQMSGLPPNANFKDVQSVLKGIYAPQHNIKWDVNSHGYKNGISYVKMSNREDFYNVLQMKELTFNGKPVFIGKCPDNVFYNLFGQDMKKFRRGQMNSKEKPQDFCYMLKGLPYATTEDDIMNFFTGLNLVDLLILYDKNGKATGTGYVQFASLSDYNVAFERNGKKIGHRYIELFESNREDIDDAKNTAVAVSKPMIDILNDQMYKNRSRSYKENIPQKRPLCIVLSGLPSAVKNSDIYGFFNLCGIRPDAVHNILNEDNSCSSGRAFAEFLDLFDLDVALKQHGKYIGQNMISVKQVLFEEMMKIIETHPVQHEFGVIRKRFEDLDSGPVPEKLPYIWEPPDAKEESRLPNTQQFSWKNLSQRSVFDYSGDTAMRHDDNRVKEQQFSSQQEIMSQTFNDQLNFGRNDQFRNEAVSTVHPSPLESQWPRKNLSFHREPYSNVEPRLSQDVDVLPDTGPHQFYEARNTPRENPKSQMDFARTDKRKEYVAGTKQFGDRVLHNTHDEVPYLFDRDSFGQRTNHGISGSQCFDKRNSFDKPRNCNDYTDSCNTNEFSPYNIRGRNNESGYFDNRDQFGYQDKCITNIDSSHFAVREEEEYCQQDKYGSEHFNNCDNRPFNDRKPFFHPEAHDGRPSQFTSRMSANLSDQHEHCNVPSYCDTKETFDYRGRADSKQKSKFNIRKTSDHPQSKNNRDSPYFHGKEFSSCKEDKVEESGSLTGDKSRAPIKFGVKTRQAVATSEKLKDAFDPEANKDEEKRKLKKLSPERQKSDKASSDKHSSSKSSSVTEKKQSDSKAKGKITQEVSVSMAGNKDQSETKNCPPVNHSSGSKDTKQQKVQAESTEKPKSADKKTTSVSDKIKEKQGDRSKVIHSNSRSTSNSSIRHRRSPLKRGKNNYSHYGRQTVHKRNPDNLPSHYTDSQGIDQSHSVLPIPFGSNGCTVQASNIQPFIGLEDLLHFFRGFRIHSQDIIRRFTDNGEPTGDVRIAFESPQEARRAVNLLNHKPLAGVPVVLFCV